MALKASFVFFMCFLLVSVPILELPAAQTNDTLAIRGSSRHLLQIGALVKYLFKIYAEVNNILEFVKFVNMTLSEVERFINEECKNGTVRYCWSSTLLHLNHCCGSGKASPPLSYSPSPAPEAPPFSVPSSLPSASPKSSEFSFLPVLLPHVIFFISLWVAVSGTFSL